MDDIELTPAYEIDERGVYVGKIVNIDPARPRSPSLKLQEPPQLAENERAVWNGDGWIVRDALSLVLPEPFVPPVDMAAMRAAALATAIEYGNRLTQPELAQWAGVEPLSWTQQRDEALTVKAGVALGEFAVLMGLAEDKGVTLESYADDVLANAARYQVVLRAAISLRRLATNRLTDEAVDTPEKLATVVAELTVHANELAAQLLG